MTDHCHKSSLKGSAEAQEVIDACLRTAVRCAKLRLGGGFVRKTEAYEKGWR